MIASYKTIDDRGCPSCTVDCRRPTEYIGKINLKYYDYNIKYQHENKTIAYIAQKS